ncbi:fibrillin-1-like, partial [Anneissia japonica]|uniref:fibrillin-1-like n=1 Tax=Anneissia japonica TaxID=1529436 RepID=UPI001425A716
MCIDETFLCDMLYPDCDNLYDESADTCNVTCPPTLFRCPFGPCTYDDFICDDYPYDCLDNYDESPELCEGKCPVPDSPENGNLIESFAYKFYRNGTTVYFVCDDGYTLQGSTSSTCFNGTFLDIPTCHENCILPTPPGHGYVSGLTLHGETIIFSCEDGFRPDENSTLTALCVDGQYTISTIMCRDIPECMEKRDDCSVNAICMNTLGSYTCNCNSGYEGNGTSCEDIDECAGDMHTCAPFPSASCTNTIGSYLCSCNEGYRGDGQICIEIVLFLFGVEHGDKSLVEEVGYGRDVISPNIEPLIGFPFGSTFYYRIY